MQIQNLHLRLALDIARNEAYDLLKSHGEDSYNFPNATIRTDRIHQLLLQSSESNLPSKTSVTIFCGKSAIRKRGNMAAHQGDKADVSQAILALPSGQRRELMIEIYKYIFDEEPQISYSPST